MSNRKEIAPRVGRDDSTPVETPPTALPARVASALAASVAENTKTSYRAGWAQFCAWCETENQIALPATPVAVAAFLAHLAESGKKAATLSLRCAAIASAHRAADAIDPTKDIIVVRALQGLRRQLGTTQEQAAPLTEAVFNRILGALPAAAPPLRAIRDAAVMWALRDGLLRQSEIVALRRSDFETTADGGRLFVARSKTDQESQGAELFVSANAATAIECWLQALDGFGAPRPASPLFCSLSGRGRRPTDKPLSGYDITRIVRGAARAAGVEDWQKFSSHSGRVGMTVDLAAAGLGTPEIALAGRWRSPSMPLRYARGVMTGRGAVARYYSLRRSDD